MDAEDEARRPPEPVRISDEAHALGAGALRAALDLGAELRSAPSRAVALRRGLPVLNGALEAFFREVLSTPGNGPVHCKAGCGACCHQWVFDVFDHELELLADTLEARGEALAAAEALAERVAAFDALSEDHPELEDRALAYFALGLPCPLLDAEGRCRVFEVRPYRCRVFFSLAPPERCTPAAIRAGESRGFTLEPHPWMEEELAELGGQAHAEGHELYRELLRRLEERRARSAERSPEGFDRSRRWAGPTALASRDSSSKGR